MSLLNDMLRDLERRQANERGALPGPMAPPPKAARAWWLARPVLIGVFLVTCLVIGAWWMGRIPFPFVGETSGSLTQLLLPELVQSEAGSSPEPATSEAGSESQTGRPDSSITVVEAAGPATNLNAGAPEGAEAGLAPVASGPEESMAAGAPKASEPAPVQPEPQAVALPKTDIPARNEPAMVADPTEMVVRAAAAQGTASPGAESRAGGPARVETAEAREPEREAGADTAPVERMSKRPVLTPEQADRQAAMEALQLWRRGETRAAEQHLRAYLAAGPRAPASRALLAQWWLQAGRISEAEILLAEVDAAAPAELRKLKARLWQGQGRVAEALALLAGNVPALAEDPDYHALLAALRTRQGDFAEAARGYAALVGLRPEQADWWVGLGIALEGDGQTVPARRAYERAWELGGLHPQLKPHVEARLNALAR